MPSWFDQMRQRILGPRTTVVEPVDEAPGQSNYRETAPTTTPVKTPLSLAAALWRLGPYVVLGIGLAMTIFAERLGSWAFLGFLLLASSPILFALRRIEELLRELIDINKMRRPR